MKSTFLSLFQLNFFILLLINKSHSSSARTVISLDSSLPNAISTHELYPTLNKNHDSRRSLQAINPLFPGYGTHFVYAYVGTPPQRQSVIIDTGSPYTGFPCAGCLKCGEHTDPYFDAAASSSAKIPVCESDVCHISMSYTEGSSWDAFAIEDKFILGGLILPTTSTSPYSFLNYFACQVAVTGLFQTQLADGIMGLAMTKTSFQYQLNEKGASTTKIFALCFKNGGGIMTIGGVDQRLHNSEISYTKILPNKNGWYLIEIVDLVLIPSDGGKPAPMQINPGLLSGEDNSAIVDSGSTDSYFPESMLGLFSSLFKLISGVNYSNLDMILTNEQIEKLPDINLVLQGTNGKQFNVRMPISSYVEDVGDGKFAFRLYFTEKTGAILGANFLNNYNVIFDADGLRLGFASSSCDFDKFGTQPELIPDTPNALPSCEQYEECSATCEIGTGQNSGGYLAVGKQVIKNTCDNTKKVKDCHVSCDTNGNIVRGDPKCPETPWSECNEQCSQSRSIYGASCREVKQNRVCTAGACAAGEGDFIILLDFKVNISPRKWSYVYSEAFVNTIESFFTLKTGSVDLLSDVKNEIGKDVRLHFEIHLQGKDYKNVIDFRRTAESIPAITNSANFPKAFLKALNDESAANDEIDYNRYGFLTENDITVLKALALPLGSSRDPFHIHIGQLSESETTILIIVGAVIGLLLICGCACCCYFRLRAENEAFSKDKPVVGSLRRMWERFQTTRQRRRERNVAATSTATYSRVPLMQSDRMEDDDQFDVDDVQQLRV